jgi:phosphopantothenoylcysteine decarboxylase / phosphopantothenate---cysteine ligase
VKILISAGPTLEPIDAVRFLSNRSSGRMGVALAQAALDRGDEVSVVHGPLSVPILSGGEWLPVETALEMLGMLQKKMKEADVLIMSAAVCDLRVEFPLEHKGEKDAYRNLSLVENPDLVGTLSKEFPETFMVSFSLENDFDPARPLKKMKKKKTDWVVYNTLKSMGADRSSFGVVDAKGDHVLAPKEASKVIFASELIGALHRRLD